MKLESFFNSSTHSSMIEVRNFACSCLLYIQQRQTQDWRSQVRLWGCMNFFLLWICLRCFSSSFPWLGYVCIDPRWIFSLKVDTCSCLTYFCDCICYLVLHWSFNCTIGFFRHMWEYWSVMGKQQDCRPNRILAEKVHCVIIVDFSYQRWCGERLLLHEVKINRLSQAQGRPLLPHAKIELLLLFFLFDDGLYRWNQGVFDRFIDLFNRHFVKIDVIVDAFWWNCKYVQVSWGQ